MQLVSLNNAGPNLTAFQFWATRGLGPESPPDGPFVGFGFDTGLSARAGLAGMSRGVLEIPATGDAGSALNHKTFAVLVMGETFVFELTESTASAGNIAIAILSTDDGAAVATKIAAAVIPTAFGFQAGGATARVVGPLANTNIGVIIEAADPSMSVPFGPTGDLAFFVEAIDTPLAVSGYTIGGTFGHALLATASKAFVYSGLVNSGDLPSGVHPEFLTLVAWPLRPGAGGVRAWIPQVVPQAWTPESER